MTITIDYTQVGNPGYIININKVDMTLVETDPTDVYELDMGALRLTLADLSDDTERIWSPRSYENTKPKVVSSALTLARVVLILAPYWVLFEDAAYNVELVGANTNLKDRNIKNQVGVGSNNSAGLSDPAGFTNLRNLILPLYGQF